MERLNQRIAAEEECTDEGNTNGSQETNSSEVNQTFTETASQGLPQNTDNNDDDSDSSSLASTGSRPLDHAADLSTPEDNCAIVDQPEGLQNSQTLSETSSQEISEGSDDDDEDSVHTSSSGSTGRMPGARARSPASSPRDNVSIVVQPRGLRVLFPVFRSNPHWEKNCPTKLRLRKYRARTMKDNSK